MAYPKAAANALNIFVFDWRINFRHCKVHSSLNIERLELPIKAKLSHPDALCSIHVKLLMAIFREVPERIWRKQLHLILDSVENADYGSYFLEGQRYTYI